MKAPAPGARRAVLFENGTGDDLRAAIARLVDPATGRYAFPASRFFTGVEQVHATGERGAGATVAIVDTGIDTSHPLLRDAVIESRNFTADPTAGDEHGHGTLVALVVRYVAPEARLINAKAFTRDGETSEEILTEALEWVRQRKPDVVNLSAGIRSPDPARHLPGWAHAWLGRRSRDHWLARWLRRHPKRHECALCRAAERLAEDDISLCAAVGNDRETITCPGKGHARGLILVGASAEKAGAAPSIPEYSAAWPDLVAPEVPVAEGTSFSTPFVAGTCALLRAAHRRAQHERQTGEQAFRRADVLRDTGALAEAAALYRQTLAGIPHLSEHRAGRPIPREGCLFCQQWIYPARMRLGFVLVELGQAPEALECFRENVAIAPEFSAAYLNRGMAERVTGQCEASLASYAEALRLAPHTAEPYDGMGLTYRAAGNPTAALQSFNRSHLANPQRRWPLLQMAELSAARGDETTAAFLRTRAAQCSE